MATLLNGLPVYKIKRNKTGKSSLELALVDYPGIEKAWVALKDAKAPLKFSTDQEKQMLYGPILIPDLPIYRYDKATKEEYYVVFTAQEIQDIVREYQQEKIKLNYQHDSKSKIESAIVQEIWLTGKIDKSQSLGFTDLPENTAFVGVFISDKTFWQEDIKSGNLTGFSIEGLFGLELKKHTMKFITAKSDKGEITSSADTFAVGVDITTKDAQEKVIPAPDGEYKLENGVTLKVAAGKCTDVMEPEMTPAEMSALEKIFSNVFEKHIKPLQAEIKTLTTKTGDLETKLSKLPATSGKTEKTDEVEEEEEVEQTVHMSAFQKLTRYRNTTVN